MNNERPKLIYDLFCDASAGPELRGACAGCLITSRTQSETEFHAVIQPHGTNNSGEIAAILLAVIKAVEIRQSIDRSIGIEFNIFSDSRISVCSMREWIFGWLNNRQGNILRKSDKSVVMNQGYIKSIYNMILIYNLRVKFYHQIGHVGHKYNAVPIDFYKFNKIPLETVGLSPSFISICNDTVDNKTRDIIVDFLSTGNNHGYPIDDQFKDGENYPIVSVYPKDIARYKQLIS